jgi:hypothetical protein
VIAQQTCDRCHAETMSTIMSYFNEDLPCGACKKDERDAPNYQQAVDAEHKQVALGNTRFTGIGLWPEDAAFLEARRRERPDV